MEIQEKPGVSPSPPRFNYEKWGKCDKGRIWHFKYGHWWPKALDLSKIEMELRGFLEGWTEEDGGLGKYQHGVNAINLIWNSDPDDPKYVWTPEAVKMMQEACANKYLGICGAASCGKSHFGAVWGLLNFYASPHNTMVLVTSTSLTAAKQRVWGSVQNLWSNMPDELRNKAKMVGSNGILRYREVDESKAQTDTRGITLVAAEAKQDKEAVAKLIGRKQERMILIADELPELSPSILTAAKGNLATNPSFQFMALGNPKSFWDAFGSFCKPLAGWDSINETTYEWPIRSGKVIRFDAMKSENYVAGKWVYRFMPSKEVIEEAREEFGENSLTFYRMYRGFFPPSGASDAIYSAYDLMANVKPYIEWGKEAPIKVAGLDVSFVSGGDKTVLTILKVGRDKNGKPCVEHHATHILKENALLKEEGRTKQICDQVKKILDAEEIQYRHLAYDSTGGGAPFGDFLALILGTREAFAVQFAERASERKGSGSDRRPAHERYTNKMAEMWYGGVEFLRGKQLAALPDDLMSEMSQRQYTTGVRGRITVQPKSEIKLTTGKSPDRADSFFLALYVATQRLHVSSSERGDAILPERLFNEACKELDIVTLSSGGLPEWVPMAS